MEPTHFYGRIEDYEEQKFNKQQKNYVHFENKILQTINEQMHHLMTLQEYSVAQLYNNRATQGNQHVYNVNMKKESSLF